MSSEKLYNIRTFLRRFFVVRKWKRKTGQKEYWSLLQVALRHVHRLMGQTETDFQYYRDGKSALLYNPKDYVMYAILRGVKKACAALIAKQEMLSDPLPSGQDATGTLLLEILAEELDMWIRRLSESLVDVINLNSNPPVPDGMFQALLDAANVDSFLRRQLDIFNFYGRVTHGNTDSSIEMFAERLNHSLSPLTPEEQWMVEKEKIQKLNAYLQKSQQLRHNQPPLPVSSGYAKRYQQALKIAAQEEKTILGYTFNEVYGSTSSSLHSQILPPPEISFESLHSRASRLALLVCILTNKVDRMLNPGAVGFLDEALIKSEFSQLSQLQVNRFGEGDLVWTQGALARVATSVASAYGYVCVEVEYLHNAPIPEIKHESIPIQHVFSVVHKKDIRIMMHDTLGRLTPQIDISFIDSKSDEELMVYVEQTLIEFSQKGLLERFMRHLHTRHSR